MVSLATFVITFSAMSMDANGVRLIKQCRLQMNENLLHQFHYYSNTHTDTSKYNK